jgi:hypothetical protein
LTHVGKKEAKAKKLCKPKEIVISYTGGSEVVLFEDADDKILFGNLKKPIIAKKITCTVKSVHNDCSFGNIGIDQLGLRGKTLRDVVSRASFRPRGLQRCVGDSYNLGRHNHGFWRKNNQEWDCYKAFNGNKGNGEGSSWATMWPYSMKGEYDSKPTKKPDQPGMTLYFNTPKTLYGVNMQQRRGYHAKHVLLTMKNKLGVKTTERIQPEDSDNVLQNFSFAQPVEAKELKIQILDIYKSSIRQPIPFLYDAFSKANAMNWIFPKKEKYDFGFNQGLWFSGDAENSKAIHSKYPWPAFGTTITGAITGDPGKCSDHFIMLSAKAQLDWSMGSSPDAIKFAWNCDELSVFPRGSSSTPAKTTGCRAANREQKFQIQIEKGYITFYSSSCRESASSINEGTRTKQLTVPNTFKTDAGESLVYVYIGASQDRKQVTKKPTFKFVKLVSAGLGMQEIQVIGTDV